MSLYLGQTRLSANRGSYGVLKKNLANIDTEGIDYLLNSKSILSGDIGSNSNVYNNILNYKHSTFDVSKFISIGTRPYVDNEGIIHFINQRNNALRSRESFSLHNNSVSFGCRYRWSKELDIYGDIEILNLTDNSSSTITGLHIRQTNDGFRAELFEQNTITNIAFVRFDGIGANDNESWVDLKASIKNNVLSFSYKYEDGSGNSGTAELTSELNLENVYLKVGTGQYGSKSSSFKIDMKTIYLDIDGMPVFNGNKTGLDVIKQDDYEVIGSPVITEDGVASGLSSVNYLTIPKEIINSLIGHKWRIDYKFITKPNADKTAGHRYLLGTKYDTNTTNPINLGLFNMNYLWFASLLLSDGSRTTSFYNELDGTNFGSMIGYLEFDGNNYTNAVLQETDTSWKISQVASNLSIAEATEDLRIGYNLTSGSIDLNSIKIYIDGNLVYQPCLKIPYTESKTGSKIVDSVYRQRISDLYELQGYAPYYSLDEQNQTYTLPKGEVYGMINKYGNEYTKSHITNTIFNTSNNINLVNSNGNLVLKAGSILYFPNGFEEDGVTRKFITKTIPSDKTIIYEATNRKNLVICLTASLTAALTYDYECYSSTTTPPPSVNRRVWYDMQNNVIKTYSPDSDTAETELISFPIALVNTLDTANKFSISKVFNSVGYIDKCLFTLPDIQLLCPNGIKDNSLNNNIITIKDIIVNNREDNLTGTYNLRISPREIIATAVQYDYHNNVNSLDDKLYKDSTIIGTVEYASGRITNLNYSDTLSLVHYGNFSDALSKNICTTSPISSTGNYTCTSYKPAVVIYNYVNGKSWYRLYSDGYCEQGGETEVFQSNTQKTISLLKQLIADNYQVNLIQIMSTDSPTCSTVNFITQRNSDSFTINYTTWGSEYPQIKYLWEAKGYIQ